MGVVAGCLGEVTSPRLGRDTVGEEGEWVAFEVSNLLQRRAQAGTSFYRALTGEASFEMGVLRRRPGDNESLITHPRSVLYQILAGSGSLRTATDTVEFTPGDLAYVREGVEHQIDRSTSVVDLLVVFARSAASPSDPEIVGFTREFMIADRDNEQNVFTPLLESSTMKLAMYMVPKNGGDALVQEHPYDELKIVVAGGGRFDLGEGGLEADQGTIAYITAGTRHQFRRTSDALDVVIVAAN